MSNRNKSLFRGPNVKHYALIHRSVRDPALNEDGATDRVLAELPKKQGRTKQDLEEALAKDGGLAAIRANEGEAASHGIYYDDTEYDYMKHLRIVGQDVDAQLVEAPRKKDNKGKGKALSMTLKEEEEERARIDQQGSYKTFLESTAQGGEGLRPDLDPALREVLEALEDDAYIADGPAEQGSSGVAIGDGEDFFENLIAGSGKGEFRDEPFDDNDDFFDEDEDEEQDALDGIDPDSAYATEVMKFKKPKGLDASDDEYSDEEYEASEGGDTIAALQAASARRPPRQAGFSDRKSNASMSAFSMSSSAMFRNEGLQTLDDRFDQIEQMYDEEESDDDDEPKELGEGRQQQFDKALDDFLTKYEVVGGKMRQSLGDSSTTPAEKLAAIREEFDKMQVLDHVKRQEREEKLVRLARKKADRTLDDELWDMVRDIDAPKDDKWDCETILSTYSNVENHPRMLRIRGSLNGKGPKAAKDSQAARITIDPKTGFPVVINPVDSSMAEEDDGTESDSTVDAEEANSGMKRQTITRPKHETPEEKKARKMQVKAEKQSRKQEKKATTEAFGAERKKQMKVKKNHLRDAADVAKGNTRNIKVTSLS